MISLIIPCAGTGNRFQADSKQKKTFFLKNFPSLPKQFLFFRGKPLFLHTVKKFTSFHLITQYIFVFSEEKFSWAKKIVLKNLTWLNIKEDQCTFVVGAQERYLSVKAALNEISLKKTKFVMIHDAVRPLIAREDLKMIIEKMTDLNKAILAVEPISDTIKVVERGVIIKNLVRSTLVAASTPQCFPAEKFIKSYELLGENVAETMPTDDTEIYGKLGEEVEVVYLKQTNTKITKASDWILIKKLLGTSNNPVF